MLTIIRGGLVTLSILMWVAKVFANCQIVHLTQVHDAIAQLLSQEGQRKWALSKDSYGDINAPAQKIILLLIFCFFKFTWGYPATIQRYNLVGGNAEGSRIAVLLSHFGPSSSAPFVKLLVKQADQTEPLFVDSAMKLSGGEKDLAELRTFLLTKNKAQLASFGIAVNENIVSEAHEILLPSSNPADFAGFIDIENRGIQSFEIKSYNKGKSIAFDLFFNDALRLTIKPSAEEQWDDGVTLRNIFRAKKVLWFVFNIHVNSLGLDSYWITVQGITT